MPHPSPWLGFDDLHTLCENGSLAVLSGAGISTESGIPDYRGPETRENDHTPIRYREFVEEADTRRRYWARSTVGWPTFDAATSNRGHRALARLEAADVITGIITQNVDRLHQEAGSERVVELHGALAEVVCIDCGVRTCRHALQKRLLAMNPDWTQQAAELAPDGDADLPRSATQSFRIPSCRACDGVLKPNVVFFGESTAPSPVDRAWALLEESDSLLVVGSSLSVYSGYRFVRGAAQNDKPVGIVNLGRTRGTPLAQVHVDGKTGEVLPSLVRAVTDASTVSPSP